MKQEIERKFLVKGEFKQFAKDAVRITQGYLSTVPERTVRIRKYGDKGFITIKGITGSSGLSRLEWEKEIPKDEAEQLLTICEGGIIDKTRYLIDVDEHTFEVDEFHGDHEGLVIAEIELTSEDEQFTKPDWIWKEVTGDLRYYNSMLSWQAR